MSKKTQTKAQETPSLEQRIAKLERANKELIVNYNALLKKIETLPQIIMRGNKYNNLPKSKREWLDRSLDEMLEDESEEDEDFLADYDEAQEEGVDISDDSGDYIYRETCGDCISAYHQLEDDKPLVTKEFLDQELDEIYKDINSFKIPDIVFEGPVELQEFLAISEAQLNGNILNLGPTIQVELTRNNIMVNVSKYILVLTKKNGVWSVSAF